MNLIEKKKRQMGQGGFTLIELLVVIAILAVLAGLAIIGIGAMRDNATLSACKADRDTIQTAAEAYDISETNAPANVQSLLSEAYVKKIPANAFTIAKSGNDWTATAASGGKYNAVSVDCNA